MKLDTIFTRLCELNLHAEGTLQTWFLYGILLFWVLLKEHGLIDFLSFLIGFWGSNCWAWYLGRRILQRQHTYNATFERQPHPLDFWCPGKMSLIYRTSPFLNILVNNHWSLFLIFCAKLVIIWVKLYLSSCRIRLMRPDIPYRLMGSYSSSEGGGLWMSFIYVD
jgi:hypothetical protein